MKYSEKYLERKFKEIVEQNGGECVKMAGLYTSGFPDRHIMMPTAIVGYVEFKTTGEPLDPLQKIWKRKIERLGLPHFTVDSIESGNTALKFFGCNSYQSRTKKQA